MAFGKKQIIAAFLEKDNVKLLAYDVSGKSVTRVFGGQVSFGEDALRDAFISDPVKFSSQVKMILTQKPPLTEIVEGTLFLHPDKTFIKALPQSESVDAFVRSLPFFKEELVIQQPNGSASANASADKQVNYVAFEKKLIEDFERPFLESGKKISSVNSAVLALVKNNQQAGRYLLVIPFEKDVTVVACQAGVVLDMATFPKDVWVPRMGEFRMGKGFSDMVTVYAVSSLEPGAADRIRNEQHLTVTELGGGDVYDLAVAATLSDGANSGSGSKPKMSMPKIPGQKYIFLVLAAIVGFALVYMILRTLVPGFALPGAGGANQSPTPEAQVTQTPTPEPSAEPADFKVIVLNGTTVAGEAGALGETLTGLGYDVVETGNATTSGFVATRLRLVDDVPSSIIDQLEETLLKTYLEVSQEPMESDTAQIEIIVGEKKE